MVDVFWREGEHDIHYDEDEILLRFEQLLKTAKTEEEMVGIYYVLSTLLAKAEENVSKSFS